MKTLVIADVHQNLTYPCVALERHAHEVDEIVFLGDWFDSFYKFPQVSGFEHTCEFLLKLVESDDLPPRKFLLGNHDLS